MHSTTDIPLADEVDLVILGGSTAATELALSASEAGARVFIATPWTYFGEDICAPYRQALAYLPQPATPLFEAAFRSGVPDDELATPLRIKRTLEQALVNADVPFLFMTYGIARLRADDGTTTGVVLANRSGFFAVAAPLVVDATEYAGFSRSVGVSVREFVPGPREFSFATIVPAEETEATRTFRDDAERYAVIWTRRNVELAGNRPVDHAAALALLKNEAFHPRQVFTADRAWTLPRERLGSGAPRISRVEQLDHADPEDWQSDLPGLFVVGTCSDLSDEMAEHFALPGTSMGFGRELGTQLAALALAAGRPPVEPSAVMQAAATATGAGERVPASFVGRADRSFRYEQIRACVRLDLSRAPRVASYDVVVVGGGTAGAPAAMSAAQAGARTLIVEYLSNLGGVGTEGKIAGYYHGNRVGFTREVDYGVYAMGPDPEYTAEDGKWNSEWKKAWLLRETLKSGVDVLAGSIAMAVGKEEGPLPRITGVYVCTPWGNAYYHSGAIVDCTGNSDVTAMAGAETVQISKAHVAVQGSGLAPLKPGVHYQNTDYTFIDDSDAADITRVFVLAREKFKEYFDLSQIPDTRQRRQTVGELSLDPLDFLAGRTFPDTVVTAKSNFDSHGFTIHPVFMAKAPDKEDLIADVPLRCLLPRGIEGVLVTGLGVSAHRDALPVIRMQADVQNQGFAAGLAAAWSAVDNLPLRELDVRGLQRALVDRNILDPAVLSHEDSFPLPEEAIKEAATSGTEEYLGLAILFAQPERSLPYLREAFAGSPDPQRKLRYAHLLALLGDGTGAHLLAEHLLATEWDRGWHFTGWGQFGFSLSPIDSMLIALANTRSPMARQPLMRLIELLRPEMEFSHFRAVTLALEAYPVREAAPLLARFLTSRGIRHNWRQNLRSAVADIAPHEHDTSERNAELKELLIARGLFACGDYEGTARAVLDGYASDLHGHYARHARAVLAGADEVPRPPE